MKKADYIILGAGASGLQLAYKMALDSFFNDKKIIIIDKDEKKTNDRTWCFWEKGAGEWDDILYKSWDTIYFGSQWLEKKIKITPYRYKMIRSQSFYNKLRSIVAQAGNIEFVKTAVLEIKEIEKYVIVATENKSYKALKVFNSLPLHTSFKNQQKYPVLQQHFVGWFIQTAEDAFDDSVATFMDFKLPQKGNTRFMYVLPITKNKALFEYTLFSKDILDFSEYELAISEYLNENGITNFTITEKEKGAIPMTAYKFHQTNTKSILQIGTAGGWTKASTGYTFMNTSKKVAQLISFLKKNNDLSVFHKTNRFWFYDLLMLDVLASDNAYGARLFSTLFKRIKPQTLLKFLDEESNIFQELKIMSVVNTKRFLRAAFQRLFKN